MFSFRHMTGIALCALALAAGSGGRPAAANGDFTPVGAPAYPSMSSLAGHMSGSSVQVFSLDDALPYGGGMGAYGGGYGQGAYAPSGYGDGYGMGYYGGPDMAGGPVSGVPVAAGGDPAVTVYPMAGMTYSAYAGGGAAYGYESMFYPAPQPRPYLSPAARRSQPSLEEQKLLMKLPQWMKPIPRGYKR